MRIREKKLKVIDMNGCGWIPCRVGIFPTTWSKYRERLEDLLVRHARLFPGFKKGVIVFDDFGTRVRGREVLDAFGCLWRFNISGLQGQVVKHPLEDWADLAHYSLPSPEKGIVQEGGGTEPWDAVEEGIEKARSMDDVVVGGMPHGFFFQRLYYLRGFKNLMTDFVRNPDHLEKLIEMLTDYNLALVERFIRLRVDMISFGDDLGLQDRMPISEKAFRRFIYPSYRKIFQRVRSSGVRVYLHTDGHIMEVADALIEAGVSVLNIQDRVNGVENIRQRIKGRVCVDLDIDRQFIVPFSNPETIRSHIREAVMKLGSKEGGLMMYSEIHADVPLENIDAVCTAFEDFMNYCGEYG
ncbi:MAG: uroporphyrinogen decarboxylase family protein [Thermoproteota archaeon]